MTSRLALKGGKPVFPKGQTWPRWPQIGRRDVGYVTDALERGHLWRKKGSYLDRFEKAFARYQDARFAYAVNSGTSALEVALGACGVGKGDEVIVPPYTFIATASAPLLCGARPVFADIEPDTYNLDPADVERKITPRTRALLPVHFGGLAADVDRFRQIAKRHGLALVEDACHAHGSMWRGRKLGAQGHVGAFSFQASKNITCGDGGIVLTNDEEMYERCRTLANLGRVAGGGFYEHPALGHNFRMSEVCAALLLGQLSRLESQTRRRLENAAILVEGMADLACFRPLPHQDERVTRRSYHIFIFRYLDERLYGVPRERVIQALHAEGVPVRPGYAMPLYSNDLFQRPEYRRYRYAKTSCPVTERACTREAMWIFHSVLLAGKKDMRRIVTALHKVVDNGKALLDAHT